MSGKARKGLGKKLSTKNLEFVYNLTGLEKGWNSPKKVWKSLEFVSDYYFTHKTSFFSRINAVFGTHLRLFQAFVALQHSISTGAVFTQPVTTVCHIRRVSCLITIPKSEITVPGGCSRVSDIRLSSNKASGRERGFKTSVLLLVPYTFFPDHPGKSSGMSHLVYVYATYIDGSHWSRDSGLSCTTRPEPLTRPEHTWQTQGHYSNAMLACPKSNFSV